MLQFFDAFSKTIEIENAHRFINGEPGGKKTIRKNGKTVRNDLKNVFCCKKLFLVFFF